MIESDLDTYLAKHPLDEEQRPLQPNTATGKPFPPDLDEMAGETEPKANGNAAAGNEPLPAHWRAVVQEDRATRERSVPSPTATKAERMSADSAELDGCGADDAPEPPPPQGLGDYGIEAQASPSPPEEPRRIQLIPFDQIQLGTERRYLVKGLVPREGLSVIWGPPKSGKSFWTFDLFMHVTLGWDYRGRRVHQGPVVYCAFEGASGLRARTEAFRQRKLPGHREPVPCYLQPVTLDLVADHPALISAIAETLGDHPPVAVVLDTLNRSLRGSESSDEDMTAYIRAADAIREAFGCAVIVVHHCGVDGTRPRGHTALTGAADAQLAVKRDGADNVVVTVEWMKDGPEGDEIVSRLESIEVGADEDGEPITSCAVVEADGEARLAGRGKPPTGATRIALEMLQRAIADAGEVPPTSNHIPDRVRAVTIELWRSYAYKGGISSGGDDAKRKAFERATTTLRSSGFIGTWGDHVWMV